MSASDKLGALPYLGLVWDYGPWWAWFIALSFGWVMMNAIAVVIENRWLFPREQYWSFYYGDLALPFVLLFAADSASDLHGGWYQASWFHWLALGLGLAGGLGQVALEALNHQYTRAQFLSPTKIWHNLVLWPVMAYWVITGTAAYYSAGHWTENRYWGAGLIPVYLVFWLVCVIHDAKPENAKPKAHINFSWLGLFGNLPQNYDWHSEPVRR